MANESNVTIRFSTKDADVVKRALADLGDEGQRALEKLERAANNPTKGLLALNAAGSEVRGGFERMTMGLGPLGAALNAIGPMGLAAGAAIGAITVGLSKAVDQAEEAHAALIKIEAVLRATQGASGKTAHEVEELSKSLARASLATEENAKQAATQLLAMGAVAGDQFDRTLHLAQDLAAAGFGELASNAVALGKALKDPASGLDALRRLGVALSEQEKEHIETLSAEGRALEAKSALLRAVSERVGGTGEAANSGLAGAMHRLGIATGEYFEFIGQNSGIWEAMAAGINKAAAAVDGFNESLSPEKQLESLERSAGFRTQNRQERIDGLKALVAAQAAERRQEEFIARMQADRAEKRAAEGALMKRLNDENTAHLETFTLLQMDSLEEIMAGQKKAQAERLKDEAAAIENIQHQRKALYDWSVQKQKEADDLSTKLAADAERTRIEFQMTDAAEQWIAGAEETADQIETIWNEAYRDMFDTWRDGWQDLLRGNITDFEDFASKILNVGLDLFANLAAAASWNSMFGGGGSNPFDTSGKLGQMAGSIDAFGSKNLGVNGLSGYLGGAAAGYAGYNLGSALLKPRQGPGNEIGGAIGGAAGMYFGGPVGAFLGSTAGSMLGGLFGAHASDKMEGNNYDFATGRRTQFDLGPKKDSPENRAAADALTDSFVGLIDSLKALGLTTGAGASVAIAAGSRDGAFRVNMNGGSQSAVHTFDDPQTAFRFLAGQLFEALTTIPAQFEKLVSEVDLGNLDAFFAKAERLANMQEAMDGIDDVILRLTDPKAFALKDLDKRYDEVRKEATELGFDLVKIEQAYALERAAVLKQFVEEAVATVDPLVESFETIADLLQEVAQAQEDALKDQIDGQRTLSKTFKQFKADYTSALVTLDLDPRYASKTPAARLDIASELFESTRSRALLGDRDAIEELKDYGFTLLDIARENFGANSDFVAIQERVRATFADVRSLTDRQTTIADQQLTVLQAQLAELQRISGTGSGSALPGVSGRSYATSDLDALNMQLGSTLSGALAGGQSAESFVDSPTFALFEQTLHNVIGGITDVGRLTSDLASANQGAVSGSVFADSNARTANVIADRLQELIRVSKGTTHESAQAAEAMTKMRADLARFANDIADLIARLPRAA